MFKVQIVENDTEKVVKEINAKTERDANKIAGGINANLNRNEFTTRIINNG